MNYDLANDQTLAHYWFKGIKLHIEKVSPSKALKKYVSSEEQKIMGCLFLLFQKTNLLPQGYRNIKRKRHQNSLTSCYILASKFVETR